MTSAYKNYPKKSNLVRVKRSIGNKHVIHFIATAFFKKYVPNSTRSIFFFQRLISLMNIVDKVANENHYGKTDTEKVDL